MPQPSFPKPWQLNLQTPVTPVAEMMYDFHTFLMWVITAISVFVLALLLIVIFRFNEKANPVPAKWSHNSLLEVVWTAIPVLVLVVVVDPVVIVRTRQAGGGTRQMLLPTSTHRSPH